MGRDQDLEGFIEDAARDIAEGIDSPEAERLKQLVKYGRMAERALFTDYRTGSPPSLPEDWWIAAEKRHPRVPSIDLVKAHLPKGVAFELRSPTDRVVALEDGRVIPFRQKEKS